MENSEEKIHCLACKKEMADGEGYRVNKGVICRDCMDKLGDGIHTLIPLLTNILQNKRKRRRAQK